jgi:hypothetical protein
VQVLVVRDAESTETNARQAKHVAMFEGNGLIDLQVAGSSVGDRVGDRKLEGQGREEKL